MRREPSPLQAEASHTAILRGRQAKSLRQMRRLFLFIVVCSTLQVKEYINVFNTANPTP
jgi:hypothetical protein